MTVTWTYMMHHRLLCVRCGRSSCSSTWRGRRQRSSMTPGGRCGDEGVRVEVAKGVRVWVRVGGGSADVESRMCWGAAKLVSAWVVGAAAAVKYNTWRQVLGQGQRV